MTIHSKFVPSYYSCECMLWLFLYCCFLLSIFALVLKVELRKTKREWKYNIISSTKFFVLGLRDNYFRDKEVSWESVDCTAFCTKSSPFKNVRKIYFLKIRSLFSDRLARFLVDLRPLAAGKFHYYKSHKLVLFRGQIILDEIIMKFSDQHWSKIFIA